MKKNKIFGALLIILALSLPVINYIYNNCKESIKKEKVSDYLVTTSIYNDEKNSITENKEINKYNYIAVLEIPDILLKRGLVDIGSKYNNIAYNIAVMESSKYPNEINTNLILAAHNGNSDVSFFKNLEKLVKGSQIYLYYNGYKYIYEIDNYYVVAKTGKININRDYTKTTITLITCKDNSDNDQVVYIGYLVAVEEY